MGCGVGKAEIMVERLITLLQRVPIEYTGKNVKSW
jgi:hypothetical protein